jgi:hypothetical protein
LATGVEQAAHVPSSGAGLACSSQRYRKAVGLADIESRSKKARRGRSQAGEKGLGALLGDAANRGAVVALLGKRRWPMAVR